MRAAVLALLPTALAATPYDGLYRPDFDWAEGWDCRNVGSDGGALLIEGDKFYGVESLCTLSNPTTVRGMDGTLYDAGCNAEGTSYGERLMLLALPDGVAVLRDGSVTILRRCK